MYDYAAGKMDWLACGLPREGEARLAGDSLVEVPTCGVDELSGAVAAHHDEVDGQCVLVNTEGVVMGTVDLAEVRRSPDVPVEELASARVTTVRASEDPEELEKRMRAAGVHWMLVTTSDGVLLGAFHPGHDGS